MNRSISAQAFCPECNEVRKVEGEWPSFVDFCDAEIHCTWCDALIDPDEIM